MADSTVKPPDVELDMLPSSRSPTDRRQKPNAHSEQVLKCPRCESLNTKFCYYNNYSLTQPRHFCKNCRRYWTKGGALRNVPIGGGCRKNKRVKQQRSADPTSYDESTSNMLASINSGSCSALLPNFSGPSSSGFVDLSSESHMLGLAFSRIQESLRLGEHSGAVSSNPALFSLGGGSSQTTTRMLNTTCSQASLMSSMPSYETGLVNVNYPSSAAKPEHGVLYNGSDLSSLFEAPTHMAGSATATLASLEDQLSTFGVPVESFNGCSLETQLKLQHQKLALQFVSEVQGGDRGHVLPAFEDETHENLRRHTKGKSILASIGDGRSISADWQHQGMTENLFDTAGDHHNFWNPGWPDMHALTGSAAGAML